MAWKSRHNLSSVRFALAMLVSQQPEIRAPTVSDIGASAAGRQMLCWPNDYEFQVLVDRVD